MCCVSLSFTVRLVYLFTASWLEFSPLNSPVRKLSSVGIRLFCLFNEYDGLRSRRNGKLEIISVCVAGTVHWWRRGNGSGCGNGATNIMTTIRPITRDRNERESVS